MRNNYVLIDFENVQPQSLEQVEHDHFKLFVFVGASQTKVPFEVADSMQKMGERAEYIKIAGNGSNALDFHIAYYIGQLAAADPTAYFHIISKDAGYDPLIQHLKLKKIFASRAKSIAEIPLLKLCNSKSPKERIAAVLTKLQQLKTSKPRRVTTLKSTIVTLFQKRLSDEDVTSLVQSLVSEGHIAIEENKVTYALPAD